jgi:hypothetical protein
MDKEEGNSVTGSHSLQLTPIGCNEAEAIRFLGCTENVFRDLRAQKIVKVLRRGWYSYRQLEEAMEEMLLRTCPHEDLILTGARKRQETAPGFALSPLAERLSTRELLKLHEQRTIRDARKLK